VEGAADAGGSEENNDWVAEFEVDLAEARKSGEPGLRLRRVGAVEGERGVKQINIVTVPCRRKLAMFLKTKRRLLFNQNNLRSYGYG